MCRHACTAPPSCAAGGGTRSGGACHWQQCGAVAGASASGSHSASCSCGVREGEAYGAPLRVASTRARARGTRPPTHAPPTHSSATSRAWPWVRVGGLNTSGGSSPATGLGPQHPRWACQHVGEDGAGERASAGRVRVRSGSWARSGLERRGLRREEGGQAPCGAGPAPHVGSTMSMSTDPPGQQPLLSQAARGRPGPPLSVLGVRNGCQFAAQRPASPATPCVSAG